MFTREQKTVLFGSDKIILNFGRPTSNKREWMAESYNPETEQSKTLAYLTLREGGPAVIQCGKGEVMIIGGWMRDKVTSLVEVFSGREKYSRTVASLNDARVFHGACSVGDAVVVCGGRDENWIPFNSCEVFSGGRWGLLPAMKEARCGVALVSSPDRRVFAIGGRKRGGEEGGAWLSSVEFCRLPVDFVVSPTIPTDFWRCLVSMREARCGPAAILFEENIFVAGGKRGFGAENLLSSVEMISTKNENAQWVSLPVSMKDKRCLFYLVIVSEKLFAFGNDRSPYNSVERLQLSRKQNSTTSSPLKTFPDDRLLSQWKPMFPITSMKKIWGVVAIPRALC